MFVCHAFVPFLSSVCRLPLIVFLLHTLTPKTASLLLPHQSPFSCQQQQQNQQQRTTKTSLLRAQLAMEKAGQAARSTRPGLRARWFWCRGLKD
jgi:hypothetical protein